MRDRSVRSAARSMSAALVPLARRRTTSAPRRRRGPAARAWRRPGSRRRPCRAACDLLFAASAPEVQLGAADTPRAAHRDVAALRCVELNDHPRGRRHARVSWCVVGDRSARSTARRRDARDAADRRRRDRDGAGRRAGLSPVGLRSYAVRAAVTGGAEADQPGLAAVGRAARAVLVLGASPRPGRRRGCPMHVATVDIARLTGATALGEDVARLR